ncbi:MAG: LacI family DNA-binding transcriptional regulator [Rhodospirillaceae bacterium]|nr:LacI family DNA-binding transcriptional regulator [Rhodospirillaceae bacterium]
MATIYEVSKLVGVSVATVSRVINGSSRVSDKTREKVLSAMRTLNYRPNSIAQSLASNRSNSVGILVPQVHGPVFASMLSEAEEELRNAGKFTIFATGLSDEIKEQEAIRFLISRNCDALIMHVDALTDEFIKERMDDALPFLIMNRVVPGLEDKCISLDNERGGFEATRTLLEMGHRRIAYISGPLAWVDASARLEGHRRALAAYGQEFDDRLLVESNFKEVGGSEAMSKLLRRGRRRPFSAVVCANDEMAAGAMDAIRARGLSIPEDISIVGFDNAPLSRYLYPKLTTVNYPIAEMGRMAARWVLRNVYKDSEAEIRHVFRPTLVPRGSAITAEGSRDDAPGN